MSIITANLIVSTLVFWIAARLYVIPRLHEWKPLAFAYPAAFGDLLAALLAVMGNTWQIAVRASRSTAARHVETVGPMTSAGRSANQSARM